jgi:hypothetical protein
MSVTSLYNIHGSAIATAPNNAYQLTLPAFFFKENLSIVCALFLTAHLLSFVNPGGYVPLIVYSMAKSKIQSTC